MVLKSKLCFVYDSRQGFVLPGDNTFTAEQVKLLKEEVFIEQAILKGNISIEEVVIPLAVAPVVVEEVVEAPAVEEVVEAPAVEEVVEAPAVEEVVEAPPVQTNFRRRNR